MPTGGPYEHLKTHGAAAWERAEVQDVWCQHVTLEKSRLARTRYNFSIRLAMQPNAKPHEPHLEARKKKKNKAQMSSLKQNNSNTVDAYRKSDHTPEERSHSEDSQQSLSG